MNQTISRNGIEITNPPTTVADCDQRLADLHRYCTEEAPTDLLDDPLIQECFDALLELRHELTEEVNET